MLSIAGRHPPVVAMTLDLTDCNTSAVLGSCSNGLFRKQLIEPLASNNPERSIAE
jgi:hypothetical protein